MSYKTQSAILHQYNPNIIRALLSIKVGERKLPNLQPNEVLIKTAFSPVNPSDIAFLQGGYNVVKPLPCVPGFEASGTVEETGKNARHLLGKKVSSFVQSDYDGSWSENFVANARDCMVLKEGFDMKQAACLGINPFTAFGLMEQILMKRPDAIIQNAAGGQLGEFIRVLCKQNNIEVINIVRKSNHVEKLQKQSYQYVLNESDEDFSNKLNEISNNLKPTIALDAVGGESSGLLFNHLSAESTLISYGGLSGKPISGISTIDIIFKNKSIIGFNLNDWIAKKTQEELQNISSEIQDLFLSNSFYTNIQKSFELTDIVDAIRAYIKDMSAGKVLISF